MKPILFYHVQKCGGTTVLENSRILLGSDNVFDIAESIDPLSEISPFIQLQRRKKEIIHQAKRKIFVHDPYGVIDPQDLPNHQTVLIIRNLNTRYISCLNMIINYSEYDISVAPLSDLSIWEQLSALESDDIVNAMKIVTSSGFLSFFNNNWNQRRLSYNDIDYIFELEAFVDFEEWFRNWANVDKNYFEKFNEGKRKKFISADKVIVTAEEEEFYRNLQIKARYQRIRRKAPSITPSTQRKLNVIERVSYDQSGIGDFYAKEQNQVGNARWLSSRSVCNMPFYGDEIQQLLNQKAVITFLVANAVDSDAIFNIRAFVVGEDGRKTYIIPLNTEAKTQTTPFQINFSLSPDNLEKAQKLLHTKSSLSFFLYHKPKMLSDGRVSSLQLAGGEIVKKSEYRNVPHIKYRFVNQLFKLLVGK